MVWGILILCVHRGVLPYRADLIIEAIVENMDIKRQLFDKVEKAAKKECILVSNTSSLPLSEICSKLTADGRKRQRNSPFFPCHVKLSFIDRTALVTIDSVDCISLIVSTNNLNVTFV